MKALHSILFGIFLATLLGFGFGHGAHAQNYEALEPDYVTNPSSSPKPDYVTNPPSNTYPKLRNPLQANNIEKLLFSVVDIMIFIGVIVAVFVFIYIGFKFVMAQGNDEALKDAKRWFMYAVIGTAILIGSKLIVSVIENTLTSAGVVKQDLFKK
jgi:hypothetical protein